MRRFTSYIRRVISKSPIAYLVCHKIKRVVTQQPSARIVAAEAERKEARLELENAIQDLAAARARKPHHGI